MASPITSSDFSPQSMSGSVCDLFRQKLLNNDKMVLLLDYLFNDTDGSINADFAADLMELFQPIGTLIQAPVDLGLDITAWLKCEGQAVSRTTYARLFAKFGTTFGSGDGSTTFNLPDLRDKFLITSSGTKSPASTGGEETVVLEFDNLPDHDHLTGFYSATDLGAGDVRNNDMVFPSAGNQALGEDISVSYLITSADAGAGTTDGVYDTMNTKSLGVFQDLLDVNSPPTGHNNIPPYMAVCTYVKANHVIAGQTL